MPRRRSTANRSPRKGKRYRTKKNRLRNLPMRVGPPKSMMMKLRYNYVGEWDPGAAGAVVSNVFRLTSVFDPDVTGVGAQPRFFDQMCSAEDGAGLYKKYVVLGAKVRIEMVNKGNTVGTDYLRVFATVSNSATTPAIEDMEEDPRTKKTILYKGTIARDQNVLTQYYSAKKFWGTEINKEDDYAGSYGASPQRNCYVHVAAYNPNGNPAGADFFITIDYIVRFFERINPGQS